MTVELWPDQAVSVRPLRSIAVAVQSIDGGGFAFNAVERLDGERWSGTVEAPNCDAAHLEVFSCLRSEIDSADRLRFLVSLDRTSLIWKHPKELRIALPGCSVQGPSLADAVVVAAARAGLPPEWVPLEPVPLDQLSREPLIVATDGSVRRRKFIGYGWLAANGQHGAHGAEHSPKVAGKKVVLVAELRAINEAVRNLPNRRLSLLCDSRFAVDIVGRWMRGDTVLPDGYSTERDGGATAGLVTARNRIHFHRDRITISWVPGHRGEPLNEGADALARLGSRYSVGDSGLTPTEYRQRARGLADGFAQEFNRLAVAS